MDIGRGNFDILSPEQANPGISMMSRIIAQHLQNQATQSRTQGQDLMNQRSAATLPYAGPQAAANLQAQNLSNEWYAPEKRAQIAQSNAYTQNTLAQAIAQRINNQYLPQKDQQDLASQGLANQLAKAMMPIQIQQAGANVAGTNLQNQGTSLQNQAAQATLPYAAPQAKAQVALTNAEAQNQLTGNGGGVDMGILNGLKKQLAQDHPDWDTNKVNDAAGQYLNGSSTFSDGTPLGEPSGLAKQILNFNVKHGNTAKGVDQQRYAATLDSAFSSADSLTDSAFKYAGADGQAKLVKDKALASAGKYDPDYLKYLQFTQQAIPALATEILRTGGANSTDQQKLMAIQQLNPVSLTSNPELAMQQYQYLKSLYGSIGKTISQSPYDINKQLKNPASPSASPSDAKGKSGDSSALAALAGNKSENKIDADRLAALAKMYPNLKNQHLIDIANGGN